MLRIGDSAVLNRAMITPQARVVESRRYWDWSTEWLEIADKCIREKRFSITTVCLNYSSKDQIYPTEIQWRNKIEDTVRKLLAKGANWNNSRVDIINEPTKHCRTNGVPDINKYIWLEHVAHDQIRGRLPMGSGCDELIYQTFQSNVASRGRAEVYVIHIQASCDSMAKTVNFTNIAQNMAVSNGKLIDCNEGNYKNVSSSSGFSLMKFQAERAEAIGCPNYCNVFNNLVRSAFKSDTTKWDFLAFKIDGVFRNSDAERHYNEWTGLMDSKAPKPNIIPIPKEDDNDMNLVNLKRGSINGQTWWLQEILMLEYGYPNNYDPPFDGKFGAETESQVKKYQRANNLDDDGIVGKDTTLDLVFDVDKNPEDRKFSTAYWYQRLQILSAYPDSYFK